MFEFHRNERLLFAVSSGVFVLLTLIIALLPAIRSQSRLEPLPKDDKMTKREQRGLQVYIDEGCAYCHTQQVRPLPSDSDLGRPSVAADYARLERLGIWRQTPAVLGSERTGPDLTTIGERQPSENWHLLHLYQPRAVVEDSVMPAFKWLFRVEK
ncbi:MAG: cbb3-type cytochrome c oxidase subunit II, partial [Bradymonadaceae bacterium]